MKKTTNKSKAVRAVSDYAKKHLGSLRRRSGEFYSEHTHEVADTLRECCTDENMLSAVLLHDILLCPDGDKLLENSPLNSDEKNLSQKMCELRRLHINKSTKDLDAFLSAFSEDSRLLIMRMAHRVNDVRHLDRFSKSLQKKIAHETLHMYAAIASRLGLHAWRYEMEDLCFAVLQPNTSMHLRKKFEEKSRLDKICIKQTIEFLKRNVSENGINCSVQYRIKSIYSTYRKMAIKRRAFEDLTDRLALRIIVPSLIDCYKVLGVVHGCMHPIPGKLKDYIGAPKENDYRSIHTVVYPLPGVTEQPMEIQIRTEDMQHMCEFGCASHGEYKDARYALLSNYAHVDLRRNLEALRMETRSPQQFEKALRKYYSEDHMAVFDHENNIYHLKKPATVLDFVSHVYPSRFGKLKSVKLNGRNAPFDTLLNDGDIVETGFGRSRATKKEWAKACRHGSTRRAVKQLTINN